MKFLKIKDEMVTDKIGFYYNIRLKSLVFFFKQTRFYIHFNL